MRARSLGSSLVSAIPVWAWLALLVCASAAARFAIAYTAYPGPWIFHDEVAYSDLARSLGRTGAFSLRDVDGTTGFGVVYPTLLAPAYALFDRVPDAYEAARAINAFVMSLAAIPSYLLARRLVGRGLAFGVAVLTVALPSMTYTTTIMTENAFYPLFVLTALAIVLALERPTILRQLLLWVPLMLAFYTRAQAIMFVPALASALVLLVLLDAWVVREGPYLGGVARGLRSYWVSWAVLLGGGALAVAVESARGRPLRTLLGAYGGVGDFQYRVGAVTHWLLLHVAEIDLYTGLLPFAAFLFIVFGLAFQEQTRATRVFSATGLAVFVWFTVAVSAYASNPIAHRIEERNLFYVAPLLFVALAVWVDRGLPRRSLVAVASVLVASVLPGAIPYDTAIDGNAVTATFGLLPLARLETKISPQSINEIVVLTAIAGGLLALYLSRRLAVAALFVVLAYLAVSQSQVQRATHLASSDAKLGGVGAVRDWIDRAAGRDADVSILFTGGQAVPFWYAELFNASVRRVYNLNGPYDGLPQTQLVPKPDSGLLLDPNNQPVRSAYAVVNQILLLDGKKIAQDPLHGMSLYETDGPLRLVERIDGTYPDTWSGPGVGYTRYACPGGSVTVTLTGDPGIQPHDQTVTAVDEGREVARKVIPVGKLRQKLTVPLRSVGGACHVDFGISPTAVPALVNGSPDARELGIRFRSFVYRPSP